MAVYAHLFGKRYWLLSRLEKKKTLMISHESLTLLCYIDNNNNSATGSYRGENQLKIIIRIRIGIKHDSCIKNYDA